MRHRSSSARISVMPNNNPHSDFLILSGYLNLPYPTPTPCGFHLGSGLVLSHVWYGRMVSRFTVSSPLRSLNLAYQQLPFLV